MSALYATDVEFRFGVVEVFAFAAPPCGHVVLRGGDGGRGVLALFLALLFPVGHRAIG